MRGLVRPSEQSGRTQAISIQHLALHLLASPQIPKVPQPPQTTQPPGDQVLKQTSLRWGVILCSAYSRHKERSRMCLFHRMRPLGPLLAINFIASCTILEIHYIYTSKVYVCICMYIYMCILYMHTQVNTMGRITLFLFHFVYLIDHFIYPHADLTLPIFLVVNFTFKISLSH